MKTATYTLPAMLLHWAQAILIVWLLWLGWTMTDLPKGAERSAAYGLHKSLGLLVLLLTPVRIGWRLTHQPPASSLESKQAKLAAVAHGALYIFLLLAPLCGYLLSAFTPYAIKFFGLELPRLFAANEAANGFFKLCHCLAVYGGAALIGLHVAAALLHAWKKDGILSRMLPGHLLRK